MPGLFFPKSIVGIDAKVLLLSSVLVVLALALLVWVVRWPDDKKHTIRYDVVKDIGIAILTAVIVTVVYSSALDFKRVSDLFSLVIGDDVRPEVLDATKVEVFKRELIRDNADFRFTVVPDPKLPKGQALLKVELSYDVYSLKPDGDRNYTFVQELENVRLKGQDKDGGLLPRFDEVSIGDRVIKGDELSKLVKDGRFTDSQTTALRSWPKRDANSGPNEKLGVRISTVRTEIVHVPGSFHVVLGEMTKETRVRVSTPDDIQHVFKSWFVRRGRDFRPEGKDQFFDGIILPGQSISLQFWRKSDYPAAEAAPAARAGTTGR